MFRRDCYMINKQNLDCILRGRPVATAKIRGNSEDAFADTKGHYSIDNCMHPYHTGDMPPLFGNQGYAFSIFLSDRFNVYDILGRTVVIHLHPDDFHTQPSGNSGMKIACGIINYNGLN